MSIEIYSVQWEYEDSLPEMSDTDYEHLYHQSEIRGGVRMFKFITIYDPETSQPKRIYLGA